jgi:hypothetical protein
MKPKEIVTYWRDPEIEGVEMCQVEGSRHVFPAHAHDGIYAIGMMQSGGSYCLGPENAYSLVSPGQIALINPNQVHSGVPVAGKRISYRMLYFDLNLMGRPPPKLPDTLTPSPNSHPWCWGTWFCGAACSGFAV